jgi:hypothetical protein
MSSGRLRSVAYFDPSSAALGSLLTAWSLPKNASLCFSLSTSPSAHSRTRSGMSSVRPTSPSLGCKVCDPRFTRCGHVYGANGSDIWLRKCPYCQGGAEGLPLE